VRVCVNRAGSPKVRAKKKPREGLLRQEEGFGLFGAVEHVLKPRGLVHIVAIFSARVIAALLGFSFILG